MFYSISGKIVFTDMTSIAVECGGVAYRIFTSLGTLKTTGGVGNDVKLYTYLSVREDAMELYGFSTNEELDWFKSLMSVSGVGPKAALSILSTHTPQSLIFAITSGDAKAIAKAQGIGPKTAQRIILDLKDKVSKMVPAKMDANEYVSYSHPSLSGNISEAQSALMALGYSQSESAKALAGLDGEQSVEDLIKAALKKMM